MMENPLIVRNPLVSSAKDIDVVAGGVNRAQLGFYLDPPVREGYVLVRHFRQIEGCGWDRSNRAEK